MINLFLPNKKTLFLIAGLGVIITILALANLLSGPSPTQTPITTQKTPTPTFQSFINLPLTEIAPSTGFSRISEEGSVEKNYERLSNKKSLSENEQIIKSQLLKLTQGESGTIYKTELFIVEYLKSADYFMVKITTPQIDLAKKSIHSWFLEQGFSQEGVCNLPVVLYLTTNVRDYLLQNNLTFNPIPEGCQ